MKGVTIGSMVMLLIAGSAWAAGDEQLPSAQKQTETWLQLQASGKAASTTPQVNTAVERDLSLQRWLETYKYAIPEHYEQEAGGNFSSGSK
ncbi:DUF3613 domain-containing protein [Pseudomonas syringae pv. tagetis]|uniref:DUF3613 domain-containing protein n=3 Tax=Pseudomonas syringae group TaxID=136849 RepID=A0A0Q0BBB8_9PSED|nr:MULTISPECIES: DUF3613 domain-containing protein [Pseudomonas syringae group]KPX44516.1 Uncharacterized protein ALO68_02947 [Pseudomonas syringae pv. helianthi]KPY90285.1 Uncharacterized protein ALO44_02025 [Pseudomonas syringae pv. tagetis]RMR10531.1 hypothetical protein ALP93_03758 [Pseudomonas syringae pv. helianthi]RMV13858.1 hypothetical protein ALP17_00341 [Pseudomonas savastanoi]RMV44106.1 hypothetical protein ALP10_01026 [Pseudomonas syringae pv. helianthi]